MKHKKVHWSYPWKEHDSGQEFEPEEHKWGVTCKCGCTFKPEDRKLVTDDKSIDVVVNKYKNITKMTAYFCPSCKIMYITHYGYANVL